MDKNTTMSKKILNVSYPKTGDRFRFEYVDNTKVNVICESQGWDVSSLSWDKKTKIKDIIDIAIKINRKKQNNKGEIK